LLLSSSIIPHKGNVLVDEQPKNNTKKVTSFSEEVEILDKMDMGLGIAAVRQHYSAINLIIDFY
jgi:hypothetical protein